LELVEAMEIHRGDIILINLEPTRGREIRKTRPCVVVSPDELNENLSTLIVAPMTTGSYSYPFRVACSFKGKSGYIVLDQIRTIDRDRIVRSMGRLQESTIDRALSILQEMFAK